MFNKIIAVGVLITISMAGVNVAGRISPDAISMGVGVLFGILAGIPTTLLMLAVNRRTDHHTAPTSADYWRERALAAEDRNMRIQKRVARLLDIQNVRYIEE